MKQTDLLGVFEDGISKEKLRKIEMRKDALIILKVKQKYDLIARRMESPIYSNSGPFVKLKDGRNLFEIEDYEIEKINYIYELKFQEIDYLRIKVLSLLPDLSNLEIKFSNIWLPDLKPEISQTIFFSNLQNLDLSFNNLTDDILHYIRSIKSLKTLNLMGNQITHEIPDLSELINLEELNLSSNNIVSYFLNFNLATNNYSENSNTNYNTHVSHFNLMLSGRDFNKPNPNKVIENNENERNQKEVINLSNNVDNENLIEDKNSNNLVDGVIANNYDETNKASNNNLQNISQINNNNTSNLTQQTTLNNLKVSNNNDSNEMYGAKANNGNEIENFDRVSNHSNNLIYERARRSDYSKNASNKNKKNSTSKNYSSHLSKNNMEDEMDENNQAVVDTYEEWQKFLRTNLQDFYHKLSALKNLKALNLSHNKIHFFDIDPYHIQQMNGFSRLNTLDISFNLIDEEISILLVMNIPNLKSIDITCNPITRKQTAYENIEYEIFKTKNILLINSKPYNFNLQIWQPPNKINFTRRKNNNKYANLINEENEKKNFYKVNSDLKIDPVRDFNKKMKSKINTMLEHRKKMDEEMIKDHIPEYDIDILENNLVNYNENNLDKSNKEEKSSLKSYLNSRKNKENVFLTNTDSHINKLLMLKDKNYEGNEGSENYINFLSLANQCFGKEKHYKNTMPISNAYQKLRFILNNLPSSVNENYDASNRYMKPTISRAIHLDEYKPDNENYKKEFKILKQINKQRIINESRNEENINSSINLSQKNI